MLRDYTPRQEPGRYFAEMFVPSALRPQRQPVSAIGPELRLAATAGAAPTIGTSVMLPAGSPPVVVTVTLPLSSVTTLLTYFEFPPSQPKLLAPGGVPPDWKISVMDVRHADAASMTSDILARTV